MKTTTLTVNGQTVRVLNTLSCGPDQPVHTYELAGGAYVYEVAGTWFLQERWQFARVVSL